MASDCPNSPDDHRAGDPDLADLAARHFAVVGIHDPMSRPDRQADGVDAAGGQFAGIMVAGEVVSVAP